MIFFRGIARIFLKGDSNSSIELRGLGVQPPAAERVQY